MNSLVLFEKDRDNFYPLSLSRHVSDLITGYFTFSEGFRRLYDLCEITLLSPAYMEEHLRESHPAFRINEEQQYSLYLRASILPEKKIKKQISLDGPEEAFTCEGSVIGFRGSPDTAKMFFKEGLTPKNMPVREVEAQVFNSVCDIVEGNALSLERNFTRGALNGEIAGTAKLISPEKIFVGANSTVEDYVLIDARKGPVHISEGVEIKSHSVVAGPVYIGHGTLVKPFTHILNGCSFGPQCRLSGEISKSLFIGYSNKQHSGFLGNSYVGEWVNFGAGTTNSNLKNNYSEITVHYKGEFHRTGMTFLGLLCGDHVKTAIGTLFNTGTTVGLGANIFKPGLTDKCIPSLSWGPGEKYSFDKFLKTAETVMSRRERKLTDSYGEMLEHIFINS
ncbi:hypothetical protein JXL83_03365 [candidate division WOR-3 bacterium]|nr:hypothetical protein [candidate division WOR-3 bacterium]